MVAEYFESLLDALSDRFVFALDQSRNHQLLKVLEFIQLFHERGWFPQNARQKQIETVLHQ